MIQSDYARASEPVAVFRLEIPDPDKTLDILDQVSNTYSFFGPLDNLPTKLPPCNPVTIL